MRLADLAGRSVAIMGTGREGRYALQEALKHRAAKIIALDDSAGESFSAWQSEFAEIAPVILTTDYDFYQHPIEVLIKSPGITKLHPLLAKLSDLGVIITGSTQLWTNEHAAHTIAVTGTKGKSTTSSLIHHLIAELIGPVGYGGNIGTALFSLPEFDRYVVEFGSYQSSEVQLSPSTVVITALFPEHLDWHGSEDEYYRDKLNLAAHNASRIVVNGRDELLLTKLAELYPELDYEKVDERSCVRLATGKDGLTWFFVGEDELMPISVVQLSGLHNLWNVAIALTVLSAEFDLLANKAAVSAAVASFKPLPHRLTVIPFRNFSFVDDTLSTSPYATIAAMQSFPGHPLTLILGGQDRGVDYQSLADFLACHPVHAIIGMPDNGAKLIELLKPFAPHTAMATNMTEAVALAADLTPSGGLALLSPAAPSYGHFKNYEDKSAQFIAAINALKQEEK